MVSVEIPYLETIEKLLNNYWWTYGVSTGSATNLALLRTEDFEDNDTKTCDVSASKVVSRYINIYANLIIDPKMHLSLFYLHPNCSSR